MLRRLKTTVAALAFALACNVSWAQLYPVPTGDPYTNPINPLDVDDNGLVQAKDVHLVIDRLERQAAASAANLDAAQMALAMAATPTTPQYFWDTNADGTISSDDARMVINHLTNLPEPGSLVLGVLGMLALVGCVWRRCRLLRERHPY